MLWQFSNRPKRKVDLQANGLVATFLRAPKSLGGVTTDGVELHGDSTSWWSPML